jgi:hypothetical protein
MTGGSTVAEHSFLVPCFRFMIQVGQGWDSTLPQALSAEQADLDLGLVQPAAVFGCAVHREPIP